MITPTKLRELKNQVQELLMKGLFGLVSHIGEHHCYSLRRRMGLLGCVSIIKS